MPTKTELQDELRDRGVPFDEGASKSELERLAAAGGSDAADVAVDGHHPQSKIEDVPEDEKPGPGSTMQREVRPDEQGDAVRGETAFAAPAGE